jgi:hypothetical protein
MTRKLIQGMVIAAVSALAIVAIAGSVYDRTTATLSTTAGTATFTNKVDNGNLILKRIWVERALYATDTVTVTRVTSDAAYTQAVGSVTCTANAGSTASFTATYLKYGDQLKFVSGTGTGAVAVIEYEVQQH